MSHWLSLCRCNVMNFVCACVRAEQAKGYFFIYFPFARENCMQTRNIICELGGAAVNNSFSHFFLFVIAVVGVFFAFVVT